MGRQSARIVRYQDGQAMEHKDIIGQSADGAWYHHDRLYYCDDDLELHLVWEKLKGGGGEVVISPFYVGSRDLSTRNAATMYYDLNQGNTIYAYDEKLQARWGMAYYPSTYNGQVYISISTEMYFSEDLKNWRKTSTPVWAYANIGEKYLHSVDVNTRWNATLKRTEWGIRHDMYSITGDKEAPTHSYFIVDSLVEGGLNRVECDKGCFGDAFFAAIYGSGDKDDVKLCVLNGNALHYTILEGELLYRITRGKPLLYYYNVFYGRTFAYMLTNEEDTTQRTLYKIGQSGKCQEYTFDVGTTDFLSPYVYQDRLLLMCAEYKETIYIYNMESGAVTSRKFDGYYMKFSTIQGGLPQICYENGNGLNIVLKNKLNESKTALAILDL
ncbi:MAG: hypothetical protein NC092_00915 [Butyrivibrio sp.]|nr:hypothetical protein [Muribaculum sp.]MCM1551233.1 hypothetical protein [Butyrivibrio sp.]